MMALLLYPDVASVFTSSCQNVDAGAKTLAELGVQERTDPLAARLPRIDSRRSPCRSRIGCMHDQWRSVRHERAFGTASAILRRRSCCSYGKAVTEANLSQMVTHTRAKIKAVS
jgi:hypothetical protein